MARKSRTVEIGLTVKESKLLRMAADIEGRTMEGMASLATVHVATQVVKHHRDLPPDRVSHASLREEVAISIQRSLNREAIVAAALLILSRFAKTLQRSEFFEKRDGEANLDGELLDMAKEAVRDIKAKGITIGNEDVLVIDRKRQPSLATSVYQLMGKSKTSS